MLDTMRKPYVSEFNANLGTLYSRLMMMLFVVPIFRFCTKVMHIAPIAFLLTFISVCIYLACQSSFVISRLSKLFAIIFNSQWFQLYLRTYLRIENALMTGSFWIGFVVSFVCFMYFGLYFVVQNDVFLFFITLFVTATLLYIQLRFSILFENPNHDNPVSFESVLELISKNLLLDVPLQNRLTKNEVFVYMTSGRWSWAALGSKLKRFFRGKTKNSTTEASGPEGPGSSEGPGWNLLSAGIGGTIAATPVAYIVQQNKRSNDLKEDEMKQTKQLSQHEMWYDLKKTKKETLESDLMRVREDITQLKDDIHEAENVEDKTNLRHKLVELMKERDKTALKYQEAREDFLQFDVMQSDHAVASSEAVVTSGEITSVIGFLVTFLWV